MPEATQDVGVQADAGTTRIDDKEANSIRFTRSAPEAGEPTYMAAFYSGSRVVAKFENLDADTLADTVGDRNAKAIIGAGTDKGILKGDTLHNEYGLSPEENARRSAAKEERKAREYAEMRAEQEERRAGMSAIDIAKEGAEREMGPEAKLYAARDNGKYSGRIIHVSDEYAVQDLNGKSAIAHEVGKLGTDAVKELEAARLNGKRITIEYGKERVQIGPEQPREPDREGQGRAAGKDAARDGQTKDKAPAKEAGDPVATELTQLKNEHMGKDAKMYMARENNGFSSYTGTIIAETGSHVLQRLNDKTVIVHEKVNLNKDVEVGENVNVTYSKGRVYVNDPSQDRQKQQGQAQDKSGERAPDSGRADADPRQSFFQARSIILKEFGQDSKVYDPNVDKGDYKGQVVVITDKHVGQRLGANTFVIHDKGSLSGEFHKGQSVQVKYNNQRATAVELTRTPGRDQGQGPSLGVTR